MLLSSRSRLVQSFHNQPCGLVIAVTGGGSGAISAMLEVPGASRTVLEAVVPYAAESLADWLGSKPEHSCSARTARAMAAAAFQRSLELGKRSDPPRQPRQAVGAGCTSSLASDRPKRGPHRVHVAVQTATMTASWSLELRKDARTRLAEEQLVTGLILNALAEAAGMSERVDLELLQDEQVVAEQTAAPAVWQALMLGESQIAPAREANGTSAFDGQPSAISKQPSASAPPRVVFPGAFNPLHVGHQRMAQLAEQLIGAPAEFEISILNVDKPPLDYTEMAARSGQFANNQRQWFTRAATFVEKSRLFPGAMFIVGIDTIVRLAEARYYGNDPAACQAAIAEIARHGCRFLVFGRQTAAGFETLDNLALPAELAALCQGVPADRFREDVSSTLLRKQAEEGRADQ